MSTPSTQSWRDRAACRDEDPEMFFPLGSTGPALERATQAKAICAGCVVRQECLDWSLRTNQQDGIWGGLTEEQRRSLRRNLQRRQRESRGGALG